MSVALNLNQGPFSVNALFLKGKQAGTWLGKILKYVMLLAYFLNCFGCCLASHVLGLVERYFYPLLDILLLYTTIFHSVRYGGAGCHQVTGNQLSM